MSKLHSGTSKTKAGRGGLVRVALFWKSHCATCSPVYLILYHVTGSCKGPIIFLYVEQKILKPEKCLIVVLFISQVQQIVELLWVNCLYFLQFSEQSTLTSLSFTFKLQSLNLKLRHCKLNGQEMRCCFFCLCTKKGKTRPLSVVA